MEDTKKTAQAHHNLFAKVDELVSLMNQHKDAIEIPVVKAGRSHLTLFQDSNFSDQFQNLIEFKKKILRLVIEDVAFGVKTLRTSTFGVYFNGKKLSTFIEPWGSSPPGSVVFTVAWRDTKAFHNWRKQTFQEVDQEQINSVVYYLCYELSRIHDIKKKVA